MVISLDIRYIWNELREKSGVARSAWRNFWRTFTQVSSQSRTRPGSDDDLSYRDLSYA